MPGGQNPNAWNNWYHAVGSTYGTWLRGDPRGFRTFQHRQHIQGDYRNPPPPGVYAPIFEKSKTERRYPPVQLNTRQQQIICRAMIEKLHEDAVEIIALAIMPNHFHLLARFPPLSADMQQRYAKTILQDGRDPAPRHFLGRARKHASFELSKLNLKPPSPVWAARPKIDPTRDRQHQLNITAYIQSHMKQSGAVYHTKHGFLF